MGPLEYSKHSLKWDIPEMYVDIKTTVDSLL
jgi:hypothetical protein